MKTIKEIDESETYVAGDCIYKCALIDVLELINEMRLKHPKYMKILLELKARIEGEK